MVSRAQAKNTLLTVAAGILFGIQPSIIQKILTPSGADTDILKGGSQNNNRARSARKFSGHAHFFMTTPTKRPRSSANGSRKASF